ncbi:MAG TPA: hypothetical protein VGL61_17625 [Kofleriaceae bacterium]|jgi:hypothetical protein
MGRPKNPTKSLNLQIRLSKRDYELLEAYANFVYPSAPLGTAARLMLIAAIDDDAARPREDSRFMRGVEAAQARQFVVAPPKKRAR